MIKLRKPVQILSYNDEYSLNYNRAMVAYTLARMASINYDPLPREERIADIKKHLARIKAIDKDTYRVLNSFVKDLVQNYRVYTGDEIGLPQKVWDRLDPRKKE